MNDFSFTELCDYLYMCRGIFSDKGAEMLLSASIRCDVPNRYIGKLTMRKQKYAAHIGQKRFSIFRAIAVL